jgi:hypothetical protein
MCKVPEGTSGIGEKEVKLNGIPYTEYKYVDPDSDFYVSGISPIIGTAGMALTLTGKNFDRISEVMLGGITCNTVGTRDSETYECEIPENLSETNEVDITIKLIDDTVYRFAKVFEYQ